VNDVVRRFTACPERSRMDARGVVNGDRRAEDCPRYLGYPITPEEEIDVVQ